MIKNHKISELIIDSANKASEIIHKTLFDVRDNCSQKEFEAYRLAVGHSMGEIFQRIVEPLSKEHPDLDPLKDYEDEQPKSRAEDIPAYDPDSPLMIERLYHIKKENGAKTGLTIQFFKPAKSKDGEDDWYCTWKVSSDFGTTMLKAFGVDAMQAFFNAITMAEERASAMINGASIQWVGGNGLSLMSRKA